MTTRVRQQAQAWIASPGIQERSALHITLIALEREILRHFALEEQEALPLTSRDLTVDEWASVGEHSRAEFTPEARAGFEEFGRPA